MISFFLKNLWKNSGINRTLQHSCLGYKMASLSEHSVAVSYKVKHACIIWPSNSSSRYIPKKKWGHVSIQTLGLKCIYSSCIHLRPYWKQSKYQSTSKWLNTFWYILNSWTLLSSKREQTISTCNNTGRSLKHFTEQKKPDTKDNISFHLHYILEKAVFICRIIVARSGKKWQEDQ